MATLWPRSRTPSQAGVDAMSFRSRAIPISQLSIAAFCSRIRWAWLFLILQCTLGSSFAHSSEMIFGDPKDCSKLDRFAYVKAQCQSCTKSKASQFVVPCSDSNCSSFGQVRCERTATNPAQCEEAKINVDWVIARDAGAQQRYSSFRDRGQSPVDAVISAQAHNPHAQDTIRNCRAWAVDYLAGIGHSPAGEGNRQSGKAAQVKAEQDVDIEKCSGFIPNRWGQNRLNVTVSNQCDVPIIYSICFWYSDGWMISKRNATVPARNGGGIVEHAWYDVPGKPLESAKWKGNRCPANRADCPVVARCF